MMPILAAIRSSTAMTPALGSCGVEGLFATDTAPLLSTRTRSVNVPPTSTPIRQGVVNPQDGSGFVMFAQASSDEQPRSLFSGQLSESTKTSTMR